MTVLVGWDDPGTTATTTAAANNGNGEAVFKTSGYVAVASGTLTSIWAKANLSGIAEYKAAIYNSSQAMLAVSSAMFGVGSGVSGWNEFTGFSVAITSGQTYYLLLLSEFDLTLYEDPAGATNQLSRSSASIWPTADSSIASGYAGISAREFPIYGDGAPGGSASAAPHLFLRSN